MKRTLFTLLLAAAALSGANAQAVDSALGQAAPSVDAALESVQSDIERLSNPSLRLIGSDIWSLDTLKLDALYERWNNYVLAHPKNELAWANLFIVANERAVRMAGEAQLKYKKQKNVVGRMEQAIPDSYIFNFCAYESNYEYEKYRSEVIEYWEFAEKHNQFADRAIELLPENAKASDYETWIIYLIREKPDQDSTQLNDLLKRYFESGQYPPEALQYHFNELQGMDERAMYIGQNEGDIIGKLILQQVLGVHRDKIFYCENSASFRPYLEAVFQRAGFSKDFFEPEGEWARAEEQNNELRLIIRYICEHSTRPVYTSASCIKRLIFDDGLPEDLKACFYNEGLTMHYSATPYDNQAVKRRNVEERYRLEYLRLAFQPSNEHKNTQRFRQSNFMLAFNYLLLLNDLLPYYTAHSPERHAWLNGLFTDMLIQMVRQGYGGISFNGSTFMIKEHTEGEHYFEVTQTPYKYDEEERTMHLDKNPENTRVLIKTDPVK